MYRKPVNSALSHLTFCMNNSLAFYYPVAISMQNRELCNRKGWVSVFSGDWDTNPTIYPYKWRCFHSGEILHSSPWCAFSGTLRRGPPSAPPPPAPSLLGADAKHHGLCLCDHAATCTEGEGGRMISKPQRCVTAVGVHMRVPAYVSRTDPPAAHALNCGASTLPPPTTPKPPAPSVLHTALPREIHSIPPVSPCCRHGPACCWPVWSDWRQKSLSSAARSMSPASAPYSICVGWSFLRMPLLPLSLHPFPPGIFGLGGTCRLAFCSSLMLAIASAALRSPICLFVVLCFVFPPLIFLYVEKGGSFPFISIFSS